MPDHDRVAMSSSFEGFHRSNRDRLVASLALHLGDVDLAADAVDHAMARAWARWDRLDDPPDAGGWVYRVALNWATSWLRRLRFRSSADLPHHAEPRTDPADVAAAAVEDPVLRDALASLPDAQRGVVILRLLHEMSTRETADALGIAEGTVRSRLARARRHLRERLADREVSR